ncbi:hypothetical protein [Arthrobacter sp. BPSS-3]|uniref:DUF7882 family protein n=1 Tax=Arthrobacter sp. BPSS-3 TaxID=3366580 RepID=UPI0037DC30A8
MGKFIYGASGHVTLNMHDEVLRAAQETILGRLARGEVFYFAFSGEDAQGEPATTAVTISSAIPLTFLYSTDKMPKFDPSLVETFDGLVEKMGGLDLSGLGAEESANG